VPREKVERAQLLVSQRRHSSVALALPQHRLAIDAQVGGIVRLFYNLGEQP
jgi:hypothetical protein